MEAITDQAMRDGKMTGALRGRILRRGLQ